MVFVLVDDSQAYLHQIRNSVRSDLIDEFDSRSYMTLSCIFEITKLLTDA